MVLLTIFLLSLTTSIFAISIPKLPVALSLVKPTLPEAEDFKRLDMKKIPLTNGSISLVDDEDYENIIAHNWYIASFRNTSYAQTRKSGGYIFMHRLIMGLKKGDGLQVDHINRNGLDNRRSNLRVCTRSQNLAYRKPKGQSSKFKGVTWRKDISRWTVRVTIARKTLVLGCYKDEVLAAKIYNCAARIVNGEFAYQNPLPKEYQCLI